MENFVNFQEMLQLEISPIIGFLENSGYSKKHNLNHKFEWKY